MTRSINFIIFVIVFAVLKSCMSYELGKRYGLSQRVLRDSSRSMVETPIDPQESKGKNYGMGARLTKVASTPVVAKSVKSTPPPVADIPKPPVAVTAVKVESPKAQLIEEVPIMKVEPPEVTKDEPKIEEKPVLDMEANLKMSMVEETANRVNRIKELSQLQSQLTKSMSRKAEVDAVISRELEALRPRLANEVQKESSRVEQLEQLLKTFKSALSAKLTMIDGELSILSQMREVRNKITEKAILNELDNALTKKSELIDIEKDIAKEINNSASNLEAEIADSRIKLGTLASVLASIPVGEDLESTRQYTWADVDKLQAVLAGSIENSLARDNKVQQFIKTYDDAMRRRGIILGVTTGFSSSKVGNVATVKKVKTPVKTPEMQELVTVLKKQSNEELLKTATEAAKNTATSLVTASASLIGAAASFGNSAEAEESKKSLTLAGEFAGDFGNSVQGIFGAIQSAWKNAVGNEPIESGTTDEYIGKVVKGVKAVFDDKTIKEQFNNVVTSITKGTSEVTNAVSLTTSTVSNKLDDSEKWDKAVNELVNSASLFFSAVTVGVTRIYETNLERQLPSGENKN